MKITLADREAQLMQILWEKGSSTVAEVREYLADVLAYTTVLTILRNLESKGYVGHEEDGKAYRYAALIEQEAAQHSAIGDLTRKLFSGSSTLLLTQLVSDKSLTRADIRRIRQLLDNAKARGKS